MSAYENGRPAIASPPSQQLARAGVPAYNRRQDLTLAYGLKPPPPEEPRPEPVRVSSVLTTPPHPVDPTPHPPAPPRHSHRPRPHAASKPAKPEPAPAAPAEPAPLAPKKRSGLLAAVVAATSLAGVTGAGLWAVDSRAQALTCDAVRTLSSAPAETGGPAPADLRRAEPALRNGIRHLMFHGALEDAASGLATDIGRLGTNSDVTEMLAVVASINDHGRAAQQGCGLPQKDLFEVASG